VEKGLRVTDSNSIPGVREATYDCPHCSTHGHHRLVMKCESVSLQRDVTLVSTTSGNPPIRSLAEFINVHYVFRCSKCRLDTYFLRYEDAGISPTGLKTYEDSFREVHQSKVVHQHPLFIGVVHESVPESVAGAANESEKCLAVGAYNACAVMYRRAIQSLCKERGAKGRTLNDQLLYLRDNHLITPSIYEWADDLRDIGNQGAHPDDPDPVIADVSEYDAEYGVKFLREIIEYVYIHPWTSRQRLGKKPNKNPPENT
jgi:Domain of unknown function (DUF4145)